MGNCEHAQCDVFVMALNVVEFTATVQMHSLQDSYLGDMRALAI